jgi:hypothetical protein
MHHHGKCRLGRFPEKSLNIMYYSMLSRIKRPVCSVHVFCTILYYTSAELVHGIHVLEYSSIAIPRIVLLHYMHTENENWKSIDMLIAHRVE